jgi:hypothetical protein
MRNFVLGLLVGAAAIAVLVSAIPLFGGLSADATAILPQWEAAFAQRSFAASVARARRLE